MKIIQIFLFIFFLSNFSNSQTGWYQVNSGTNKPLYSICFVNSNIGFAVGEKGTVIRTVNGGITWQPLSVGDTTFTLRKIYFIGENTGYILGNSPLEGKDLFSRIYKTTNGGITWSISQNRVNGVFLRNMEFVMNIGYMSGGLFQGDNKFFKSTNGGYSWSEINTNVSGAIISQKFISRDVGYLGIMNEIYKTVDAGVSWAKVYENTHSEFDIVNSINFITSQTGFACGGNIIYSSPKSRFIIKTTDGGNSWEYLLNDTLGELVNNILVINNNLIYGCGAVQSGGSMPNSAFIIRTTDGGLNWSNENISSQNPLYNIINSNTNGFAIGFGGVIFKKDNVVSIGQISTIVPSSINLYQNYPNPFNPETTIKFDVPKSGFVSLRVYDISGKEAANLLEGVKEAGSYQLKFNGTNLNSGVYFYKLMTNESSITKSMVLVK